MALHSIVFTEKVVRSFLRYQLTAYPFADEGAMTRHFRRLAGYLNAGDLREARKKDTSC